MTNLAHVGNLFARISGRAVFRVEPYGESWVWFIFGVFGVSQDLPVTHLDLASEHLDLASEHLDLASEHQDLASEHQDLASEN